MTALELPSRSFRETSPARSPPVKQLQYQLGASPAEREVATDSWGGATFNFRSGRRLCAEGEPAEYLYRIIEGVAEAYSISVEGRRRIIGFYARGDLIGLEVGSTYTVCVDAIAAGRINVIKRRVFDQMIAGGTPAPQDLWLAFARCNKHTNEHILRLGLPALERVGAFILDYCDRVAGCDKFCLPMTRQEIADHLNLTIETVARSLTLLRHSGLISISGWRNVTILDRARLRRLTS